MCGQAERDIEIVRPFSDIRISIDSLINFYLSYRSCSNLLPVIWGCLIDVRWLGPGPSLSFPLNQWRGPARVWSDSDHLLTQPETGTAAAELLQHFTLHQQLARETQL